jgi:hypothetical protein
LREDVRHGGARFGAVRIAEECREVIRVHARADLGEARRLLGSARKRRLARVAGRTVQLLDQDQPLEIRIELAGDQAGNDRRGEQGRTRAEQKRGCNGDDFGSFCNGWILCRPGGIPTLFLRGMHVTCWRRHDAPVVSPLCRGADSTSGTTRVSCLRSGDAQAWEIACRNLAMCGSDLSRRDCHAVSEGVRPPLWSRRTWVRGRERRIQSSCGSRLGGA